MKNILKLVLTVGFLSASIAQAATYIFEPYVDAQYACNWIEGTNATMTVEADTLAAAVALIKPNIGQSLVVGCNRDEYRCVHHQDVEPKPILRRTEDRSLPLIGGRLLDAVTKNEIFQFPGVGYHRNLKRLPKCNVH